MTDRSFAFARRPKWIVGHVLAFVAVAVFIAMGFWQMRRLADRQDFNARLIERTVEADVPLVEALSRYGPDQDSLELRVVTAAGNYAPHEEVILVARSYRGVSGHHVLTPLYIGGDRAVIVNRGWVPIDLDQPGRAEFVSPMTQVTVVGVLRKDEPQPAIGPSIRPDGVVSQVPRVDLSRLDSQVEGELLLVYVQLLEQTPAQPGDLPRLVPLPEPSEGPHRGYAVQWFLFALVTIVGYPILLVRTATTAAIPSTPSSGP